VTGLKPLVRAHFLASRRNKTEIFFTFAFPLIFVVVFGLMFGNQPAGNGKRTIDYMAPGVMAWGVGNAAVFGVGYSLVKWRETDLLRLIRRTPTSVLTLLVSRLAVVLAVALVQAALFLAVAMAPPFHLHVTPIGLLLTVPVLVCGGLAFYSLGVLVGNVSRTSDAVAAISNCVMVPMAFLSGSFIPLSQSPGWLRAVSYLLPLRYMNQAITGVLGGGGQVGRLVLCCLVLLAFAALVTLPVVKNFRWENKR
jgi:ABC-2 type transport system permease protein